MADCIFITGGTGKIGQRLALHFLDLGWQVLITSRSQDKIEALRAEWNNDRFDGIEVDLETPEASANILAFLQKKNIKVTSLVNNARNLSHLKIAENGQTERGAFQGELLLDVVLPYELSMALAKAANSQLNSIVNVSSMYGVVPPNPSLYDNFEHQSPIQYGVAKAAQIHLTKELAVRLAPQGIRVNAVSYGGVEGRVPEDFLKRYANLNPMRRMLQEEEVAGPVEYLVTKGSSAMTGHNLIFDGGWSLW